MSVRIRRRAHALAQRAYSEFCGQMQDAIAAGELTPDEVFFWKPAGTKQKAGTEPGLE